MATLALSHPAEQEVQQAERREGKKLSGGRSVGQSQYRLLPLSLVFDQPNELLSFQNSLNGTRSAASVFPES